MSVKHSDSIKTKMPSLTSNDTIKKLIHSASVLVKQLDAAVAKAKACRDLFTSDVIELRSQLAYLCVKSIGADPLQCRRRAEELLWKKCYYDVISYAKINGKKFPLTATEKLLVGNHIDSGITKFTELMQDVFLRLKNVDPHVNLQLNVLPVLGDKTNSELANESKEELLESVQKLLIWLGDLSRYHYDLDISNGVITAERFYHQAIIINNSIGLPYNQLGTLTSHNPSRGFESIFYYTKSMKAVKVFPGAEPNLKALLARLSVNEDKLISSFSQLFPKLAFVGKEENAFEVSQLCQATLCEVQNRLRTNEHNHDLLDLAACAVMCTVTQTSVTNNQATASIAFCCSLFSHVLNKFQELFNLNGKEVSQQNENRHSNENDSNPEVNQELVSESSDEDEEETKRAKLRRRKVGSGSSDQEFSEEELFLDVDSDQESEEEEVLSDSGFHSAETKVESHIEISSEAASLLPVFKLLTDWFQVNDQVVQVSNMSIRKMWTSLAEILNALKRCQKEDIEQYRCVPLEEDWKLHGVSVMSPVHAQIDFGCSSVPLTVSILSSIRIERILQFGIWLAQKNQENGFKFENGIYSCPLVEAICDKSEEVGTKADVMMRNMAHLWLKSEVQELERCLNQPKRKKKASVDLSHLSYVYLVPDVSALSDYTHLIKQVIKSQKLIVVIPDIVISEIDQLKKESSSVRDCIRWLESCFRTGNRFVRAQRQNEHQVIPLLTYPKRKDKANWTLFQILECCHYLDTQQRNVYKTSQSSPIVVFLTGKMMEETDQYTKGICNSIGVEFKTVNSLMRKSKPKKR